MEAFRNAPSFNGSTTREAVQKALDDGASALKVVAALAALVPLADIKALENGQTMVDYFKKRLL